LRKPEIVFAYTRLVCGIGFIFKLLRRLSIVIDGTAKLIIDSGIWMICKQGGHNFRADWKVISHSIALNAKTL